jgi:VWFA-related protein
MMRDMTSRERPARAAGRGRVALLATLALVAAGAVTLGGQTPPTQAPPTDTPTFRVDTRIATIDAVVVDQDGKHVTDLTPADFEVVERGKRQAVRQAVYVKAIREPGVLRVEAPAAPAEPAPAAAPAAPAVPIAARPLQGRQAAPVSGSGRVIAIVVDDLGLSFESTAEVRRMLTKYVDSKVEPGDLVAIIRTAGGVGALQQFTTDRRMLHAAIDRVRWSLQSRSGVGAFAPVEPDSSTSLASVQNGPTKTGPSPIYQSVDALRGEIASVGSMGALEYVVRGIEPLPGRKSVIFVSEGFDLGIRDNKVSRAWSAFTRVMDRANRAGVVVYTIDARGLQIIGMSAEDNPQTPMITPGGGPGAGAAAGAQMSETVRRGRDERMRDLFDSQDSLLYLAEQTGGLSMLNTNDLAGALAKAVDDARGYYLIGFDTSLGVRDGWNPDDYQIRVTRPGLRLRARRGLFGPGDKDRPREAAPADPLLAATLSPFSNGDIDVRLTALFGHDKAKGSFVRSLFFVDPAALTFVEGANGLREADLTLLLLAVGDNGIPVGQARIHVPLRLDAEAYRKLRQRGLLYSARLPIKAAGGYQIRAAIQDDRSRRIGTSAQFVEVPKVGKDQVALSSVVLMDAASAHASLDGSTAASTLGTDALGDGVLGEPAIKIFKPGTEVLYALEIYDGRGKREDGFTTRATLLRNGRAVYSTPVAPVGGAAKDAKPVGAVPVGGRLSLGQKLPRGSYTLQVSVAPAAGPGRGRLASQWVDFEVR